MTALTAAAPLAAPRRPVPWARLAWVTWRQHRAALAGVAVLLGALSLYLLVTGLKIRAAYASVTACHPAGSAGCQQLSQLFDVGYYRTARTTSGLLQAVPVLIGVFAGAPLLARELETGTFRFAWTQGCGRTRWTIAAFAIGVSAGVVTRRTVPAMAAALAAWTGLDLATALFLRTHYEAPIIGRVALGLGGNGPIPWVLGE